MPVRIVGSGSIEGVADYEALSVAHPDAAGTNMVLSADGSVAFDSVPASIQSAIDAVPPGGFDAAVTIIASDAAWPVPTLGDPIVKISVIGGGGGGGGEGGQGGTGGTTTFGVGASFEVAALGGQGGQSGGRNNRGADVGRLGFVSGNGGRPLNNQTNNSGQAGSNGIGGEIKVAYVDLTAVVTVSVVIGAGGSGQGGRGEVIVEYKAG